MSGRHTDHRAYRRNRARLRKNPNPICHGCGRPIDQTLPAKHPMSFEADHHIPYSKGGGHGIDNLRAMHRQCNLAKGNRATNPANDTRRCREW